MSLSTCLFTLETDAVFPTKAHSTDAGYDLSIIRYEEPKPTDFGIYTCGTGIRIQPPDGYYAEIHGRSSLAKKGYRIANTVGIIDPSYRGELLIQLQKIHPDAPDLSAQKLPFKCAQLIFKKAEPVVMVQTANKLEATARGEGGFGSSDCPARS